MSDKDDTPTVNGVELDSVVGVANAFSYLDETYNVGHITVRSSEDLVIIHSRGSYFDHMHPLLQAQNRDTSVSSTSLLGLIPVVIRVSTLRLSEVTTTTHRLSTVLGWIVLRELQTHSRT